MRKGGTRVALVTGANRGLGLETSRQLLAKGLDVVLAVRDEDALWRALGSLGEGQERGMTVRMDVTDRSSYQRTFDTNVFGVQNGHGRALRSSIAAARRRHDRLAGDAARQRPDWWIFPRPSADRMVAGGRASRDDATDLQHT